MWPEMDDCMTPVTRRAVKPFVDTHPHADLNSVIDNKKIETKLQDNCIPDIYVIVFVSIFELQLPVDKDHPFAGRFLKKN